MSDKDRVRLTSKTSGHTVKFDVTPDLSETIEVNYSTVQPTQAPGGFQVYEGTSPRSFNLSGIRLISRTMEEATRSLIYMNRLKGWAYPYFGLGTAKAENNKTKRQQERELESDSPGTYVPEAHDMQPFEELFNEFQNGPPVQGHVGAPPDILELSAYGDSTALGMLYKIPVVISSITIPYPSDVDYMPTYLGSPGSLPFPTILQMDISLMEAQSPASLTAFNLQDFHKGRMVGF